MCWDFCVVLCCVVVRLRRSSNSRFRSCLCVARSTIGRALFASARRFSFHTLEARNGTLLHRPTPDAQCGQRTRAHSRAMSNGRTLAADDANAAAAAASAPRVPSPLRRLAAALSAERAALIARKAALVAQLQHAPKAAETTHTNVATEVVRQELVLAALVFAACRARSDAADEDAFLDLHADVCRAMRAVAARDAADRRAAGAAERRRRAPVPVDVAAVPTGGLAVGHTGGCYQPWPLSPAVAPLRFREALSGDDSDGLSFDAVLSRDTPVPACRSRSQPQRPLWSRHDAGRSSSGAGSLLD